MLHQAAGAILLLISPVIAGLIGLWMGRMAYRGELSHKFVCVFFGAAMFGSSWGMIMDFAKWLSAP